MAASRAMRVALVFLWACCARSAKWDPKVDPACCAYPDHDPRDYNYPYSHFLYSEVIPDVIGTYVAMTELRIEYGGAGGTHAVQYGAHISPTLLTSSPSVAFDLEPDRDEHTLHTLMAVDPDVPFRDRPTDRERVLWLVHDIPANATARGKTLVEYAPPAPQPCDDADELCLGEHRVTFILWEQPDGPLRLEEEDVHIGRRAVAERLHYKARDFAARHALGLQIGLNFLETSAVGKGSRKGKGKGKGKGKEEL